MLVAHVMRSASSSSVRFVHLAPLLVSLGCGLPFGGETTTTADGGVVDDSCRSKYPVAQTMSEGCCPGWGFDACGANLFCAAFDGRTQPTCYPEYSRRAQTTCTEDRQCVSGFCNRTTGKCRSMRYEPCTDTASCAPTDAYGYGSPLTCQGGFCSI